MVSKKHSSQPALLRTVTYVLERSNDLASAPRTNKNHVRQVEIREVVSIADLQRQL